MLSLYNLFSSSYRTAVSEEVKEELWQWRSHETPFPSEEPRTHMFCTAVFLPETVGTAAKSSSEQSEQACNRCAAWLPLTEKCSLANIVRKTSETETQRGKGEAVR